jgi:hypothetical protein
MEVHMQASAEYGTDLRGDRVRGHTAPVVNRRIDRSTQAAMDRSIAEGRDAVLRRLSEIDREWDIDRALMVIFPIAAGVSSALGMRRLVRRRWFGSRSNPFLRLFTAQLGFLLLHGAVGWCPPASLLRRLGFRTKAEIERERWTLLRHLEGEPSAPRAGV